MSDKNLQQKRLAQETENLAKQKDAEITKANHNLKGQLIDETSRKSLSQMGQDQPLSILIADDNEINRIVQQAQLEVLDYRADTVTNGEEVLQALQSRQYDVLLLDILMPVLDGIETARRIREMDLDKQPYIIAVTASALPEDRQRSIRVGINDYVAKPVVLTDLASKLKNAYRIIKESEPAQAKTPNLVPSDIPVLQLEELRFRLGNSADELLRRVVPVFVKEMPGRLCTLREAHSKEERDTFGRLCHSLKGSCRSIGAYPLASECEKLEQLCFESKLPSTDELEALISLSESTAQALSRELQLLDDSRNQHR